MASGIKNSTASPFVKGGGEMGELIRRFDWSKTSLGNPEKWGHSLVATLRILLHSSFPMFLFWGKDLICFYNDAFLPSLGADGKHPAIGKPAKEVWPEIWEFIGPLIDKVMTTGIPVWFEDQLVPFYRNGRIEQIYWTFSYSPVYGDDNEVTGVFVTCTETTEKVLNYQKLQESGEKQSRLAAIVNTSDDSIISKTLDGMITSWNIAAERMFGYSQQEAIGKHISLIIPTSRLKEEEYIISQIKAGNKVDHFNTFRLAKDGHEIPISLTISPIIDSNGKIIGASKIARDISAQQDALESAKKYTEEIKALNEKKDEFIGLASHELKTPLTSISGYLQILRRMTTDEQGQKFVNKTLQQVKKLTTLVDELLDVSKIEAGKLQLNKEEFDMKALIEDAIELTHHTAGKYRITFETNLNTCKTYADSQRIEQVLINLLTNAIKYSPGSNHILVSLSCDNNEVKVGITDFGLGIPSDKLTHIFSRFYRVEDSNSHVSGLGIGLYISNEIITRHHGKIWVESELSKGSTFYFTLPAK